MSTATAPAVASSGESYADALRERLRRVRAEVEAQGSKLMVLRESATCTRDEAEANNKELVLLREQWAAGKPQREALLKEAGDRERSLAERERRCAEALAAHAIGELARAAETHRASVESTPPGARQESASPPRPGSAVASAAAGNNGGPEARQRLAMLEDQRSRLSSALQELRDAAQKESVEIEQLRARSEMLRRESKALRAGADAAREDETRVVQKLESLDATAMAVHQRQAAVEKKVAEMRAEVRELRGELAQSSRWTGGVESAGEPSKTSAARGSSCCGGKHAGVTSKQSFTATAAGGDTHCSGIVSGSKTSAEGDSDEAVRATNVRLKAKVASLREELQKRREALSELRNAHGPSVDVSAAAPPPEGCSVRAINAVDAALADEDPTWRSDETERDSTCGKSMAMSWAVLQFLAEHLGLAFGPSCGSFGRCGAQLRSESILGLETKVSGRPGFRR